MVLSYCLATEGVSSAVIDKSTPDSLRIGENLVPAVKKKLQELGLWNSFSKLETNPIYGIHSSWGSSDLTYYPYIYQQNSHGWQVARKQFDCMLFEEAKKSGVNIFWLTEVVDCNPERNCIKLSCQQNNSTFELKARLLIDAGGRTSTVPSYFSICRQPIDNLIGVGFTLPVSHHWESTYSGSILLESSDNGWWYVTELPDKSLIAVFMTDGDLWEKVEKHHRPLRALQIEMKKTRYAGQIIEQNSDYKNIYKFPAYSQLLKPEPTIPFLPVGDSHFSRDPLAGQGIYWGLESAINSTSVITSYLNGDQDVLRDYTKSVRKKYRNYLENRWEYYGLERRWSTDPFWKRRHVLPDKILNHNKS